MKRLAKQLPLFGQPAKRARKRNAPRRGRRPREERAGFVPHVTRPVHESRHPVHVTMRAVRLAPSFRSERVRSVIVRMFASLKARGVRVIHYSIQRDHLHLMVEAHDRVQLSRKMQLLFSRIALAVNRIAGRRRSLFRDRHHRVELTSPTQTRNALVYILFNSRKHDIQRNNFGPTDFLIVDELSSAPWFEGWHEHARPSPRLLARCREQNAVAEPPTSAPRTWLANVGWRRGGGPVRLDELPRSAL